MRATTPPGVVDALSILLRWLTVAVLLVGLAERGAAPRDGTGPRSGADPTGGSITVRVTYQNGGPVYVEGAVTVLKLLDTAGHQLEPTDGPSENIRVFENLPRGEYRLVGGRVELMVLRVPKRSGEREGPRRGPFRLRWAEDGHRAPPPRPRYPERNSARPYGHPGNADTSPRGARHRAHLAA